MRKVRYKTLRVDMGGVWVSLLLLLYLVPGAPGLGDHSNSNTRTVSTLRGVAPSQVGVVPTPTSGPWQVRRARVGVISRTRRSRRRVRNRYYVEDPEDDYDEDDGGSENQVDYEDDEGSPEDEQILLDQQEDAEEESDEEAPPDSTELRERHRVSEHENPPEPPTKPNYTREGEWAKPPPQVATRLPFVPVQNYAQVRRYETELHLSPEDALANAANKEEAENAPRLREVVTHHKTQEVYSEEGYEDAAYDHGGYDKHGEHHEVAPGWEMTAVRLQGKAAEPKPQRTPPADDGEDSSSPEEDDDEQEEDHDAEGSSPRVEAVAPPGRNISRYGALQETRGTWGVRKVSSNENDQVTVHEASGNISEPTSSSNLDALASTLKSEREDLRNSTLSGQGQPNPDSIRRAIRLKEKQARIDYKRSKKWGREKKKSQLKGKRGKKRLPPIDEIDVRENEIRRTRSSKEKKMRKKRRRAKRMKANKNKAKRNKSSNEPGLLSRGTHVDQSVIRAIIPPLGAQDIKGNVYSHQHKKTPLSTANKSSLDWAGLKVDGKDQLVGHHEEEPLAKSTSEEAGRTMYTFGDIGPLQNVMRNPQSMYHRDRQDTIDLPGSLKNDNPVAWPGGVQGLIPVGGSYGNGGDLHSVRIKRMPLFNSLSSADSSEVQDNVGLATVLQPEKNTPQGFFNTFEGVDFFNAMTEYQTSGKKEKRSVSTTTTTPLPRVKSPAGKFPKTEAILQMETRALRNLQKTHGVKRLPSNLKHVKPLIGVTASKDSSLTPRQIQMMRDIGKRSFATLGSGKNMTISNQQAGLTPTSQPTSNSSSFEKNETKATSEDKATYIANLTQNHLSMQNYSWPPQVRLFPATEVGKYFKIPPADHKDVSSEKISETDKISAETTVMRKKMRRNVRYHPRLRLRKVTNSRESTFNPDSEASESSERSFTGDKYPFYKAPSSEQVSRYSPLRYALNPWEIPAKTDGGMEFYESREKYKRCKEVQPPKDIVPQRAGDGQWVQNTDGPDGPRISGLGEVISCLREKLFGKDPLDNPFFSEKSVSLPEDPDTNASLNDEDDTAEPKNSDQLDFYKDLLSRIHNTALKPIQYEFASNPYVYVGRKLASPPEGIYSRGPIQFVGPHSQAFNSMFEKAKQPLFENESNEKDSKEMKKLLVAQFAPKDAEENNEDADSHESVSKEVEDMDSPMYTDIATEHEEMKKALADEFGSKDMDQISNDSDKSESKEDKFEEQKPKEQPVWDTPKSDHESSDVDSHKPFKMTEDSKKYLDDLLDELAGRTKSENSESDDRSQINAQETFMRVAPTDGDTDKSKEIPTVHPSLLKTLKYRPKFTSSTHPSIDKEPGSHEKLLSWPKAKHLLRDVDTFAFESSETNDPVRSKSESDSEETFHAEKENTSGEKYVHEHSFNVKNPLHDSQTEKHALPPPELSESPEDKNHTANDPTPVPAEGHAISSTTKKPTIELDKRKVLIEPSANKIAPSVKSPGLPEPIYHPVRGVGGIKAYHMGIEDDSVIEIPTTQPVGENSLNKSAGYHESPTDRQKTEEEQQTSNKPVVNDGTTKPVLNYSSGEDRYTNNNMNNDSQDDQNSYNTEGNNGKIGRYSDIADDSNASHRNNDHNEKGTNNKQDYNNENREGNSDGQDDGSNQEHSNNSDKETDPESNDNNENDDKSEAHGNENNGNDQANDDNEGNNDDQSDFDEWFKETPYKSEGGKYKFSWEDPQSTTKSPFSKEWHRELEGKDYEFENDDIKSAVEKHVDSLFNDDSGHDAYPETNGEPQTENNDEKEQGEAQEDNPDDVNEETPHEDHEQENTPSQNNNAPSENTQETPVPEQGNDAHGEVPEEPAEEPNEDPKNTEDVATNPENGDEEPPHTEDEVTEEQSKPQNTQDGPDHDDPGVHRGRSEHQPLPEYQEPEERHDSENQYEEQYAPLIENSENKDSDLEKHEPSNEEFENFRDSHDDHDDPEAYGVRIGNRKAAAEELRLTPKKPETSERNNDAPNPIPESAPKIVEEVPSLDENGDEDYDEGHQNAEGDANLTEVNPHEAVPNRFAHNRGPQTFVPQHQLRSNSHERSNPIMVRNSDPSSHHLQEEEDEDTTSLDDDTPTIRRRRRAPLLQT